MSVYTRSGKKENDVMVVYTRRIENRGQWEAIYKNKDFKEESLKEVPVYAEVEDILAK